MSVESVLAHGALGNGVANDTPAINTAIATAGDGGTVYFPPGRYRITSTITTGSTSLRGEGFESVILVDVGSASDGVVINPAPQATAIDLLAWSNLAILGAAGCCKRGLVIDTVTRSTFRNVHVLVGAAQYGIYMRTSWSNHFNFTCSGNMQGIYYDDAGATTALPTLGHIRGGAGTGVGGLNANVFDCLVEGGGATPLLYLEDQSAGLHAQGNNTITGTYEGSTGRGVYAEGCLNLSMREFHVEHTTGVELKRCQLPHVVAGVTQRLVLREVENAFIDQVQVEVLDVDAASSHTRLGTLVTEGVTGVVNLSPTTVSIGSIKDANRRRPDLEERVRHTTNALANPENLIHTGDFSRWVAGMPEGWSSGTGSVVRTGDGQADTRRNLSPSAAKVTITSISGATAPLFWYTLRGLQRQWFTTSLYVYLPSGQALTELELVMYYDSGDVSIQSSGVKVPQTNGWYKLQAAFYGIHNITTYNVTLRGNAAGTFYVADAQAAGGAVAAANTFVRPANVSDVYYLEGHRIAYGTAAPATGNWNEGDVVYTRTPYPGGYVGWVCTESGTPGTWKGFGQIAP